MAKNNAPATKYAQPHTMSGKPVSIGDEPGEDLSSANSVNMSVGNISRRGNNKVETTGIKTRGNGAATKGTIARGPMA